MTGQSILARDSVLFYQQMLCLARILVNDCIEHLPPLMCGLQTAKRRTEGDKSMWNLNGNTYE